MEKIFFSIAFVLFGLAAATEAFSQPMAPPGQVPPPPQKESKRDFSKPTPLKYEKSVHDSLRFNMFEINVEESNAKIAESFRDLPEPKNFNQAFSYALGYDMGRMMGADSVKVDFKYFFASIIDGYAQQSGMMERDEITEIMKKFEAIISYRQKEELRIKTLRFDSLSAIFPDMNEKFLAQNKKKENVVTTESGLQYEILKEGEGETPDSNRVVRIGLVGKLINGDEFHNTYDAGKPFDIPVSSGLPGMIEALTDMKVGEKRRLVIPPDLAFGEMGAHPDIPEHAIIIYEIELFEIVDKMEPSQNPLQAPGQ